MFSCPNCQKTQIASAGPSLSSMCCYHCGWKIPDINENLELIEWLQNHWLTTMGNDFVAKIKSQIAIKKQFRQSGKPGDKVTIVEQFEIYNQVTQSIRFGIETLEEAKEFVNNNQDLVIVRIAKTIEVV